VNRSIVSKVVVWLALLMATAITAYAQPNPASPPSDVTTDADEPCAVKLKRAEADIARELLREIRALRACNVELDVYIVKVEAGYYLLVRDSLGRMQDRVVPSIGLAATLVASFSETPVASALRATPAIDDESPTADDDRKLPISDDGGSDVGRLALLVARGQSSLSFTVQSVELQFDLGRTRKWVYSLSAAFEHSTPNAAVLRVDQEISRFWSRREAVWGTGYFRYRTQRSAAMEPFVGVGVAALRQQLVEAGATPGLLTSYKNQDGLAARALTGLMFGYDLDQRVRFMAVAAISVDVATGGAPASLIGSLGIGLRYTP
jgi:hypothetical protein